MGGEDVGRRHLDLAEAAAAAFDGEGAAEHLSAAIRALTAAGDNRRAALACARLGDIFANYLGNLTAAGDNRRAALACARLGDVFANYLGNLTAARAWFVRAQRLIENEPPCIEQGWVAVAAMGCDVDDPDVLLENSELALDRARRFGDVNLEAKALADAGLAHVQAGRLDEGMVMLDEAMALVCGPADDHGTAGKSVCSFFTACYFACDFDKAGSWVDVLRRRGLLGQAPGAPAFVASHCDAVQATLLCELGQWSEAERVLLRAVDDFERTMGMPSWHPAIALAELRVRQGRFADAEQLLLGKEAHMQALLPAARLHAARGDHALARATAERGLRAIGNDRLRAAELLALLVDVEVAAGDIDAASRRCADLAERSKGIAVPAITARIASSRARAAAAFGDTAGAIRTVEDALDAVPHDRLPFVRALLLIDLARLHDDAGDVTSAKLEAARAVAALADLDVVVAAADRELLDRLTAPSSARSGRRTHEISPDRGGWIVTGGDARARVPASKGMRYLVELLRNPGVERHALDLVDIVEGFGDGVDRRALGDAGDTLDAAARTSYRRRAEQLRAEIDEAIEVGAEDRALQLQAELDDLVSELSRAFGLGGRARRQGSAAERARLNVTRALRTAVKAIGAVDAEGGAALDRSLRTGLYCAYDPAPGVDVHWIVHS